MSGKKARAERREAQASAAESFRIAAGLFLGPLNKLRQEFARRLKIQRKEFPNMAMPCKTCAFRTSADFTDGDQGFVQTTVGVIAALACGQPFYCHEDATPEGRAKYGDNKYQPRYNQELGMLEPCAGWWVLNSTTPEPLNVRDVVPDYLVTLAIDGHRLFNGKA